MSALTVDFVKLMEELPPGTWVAFASDQKTIICHGSEFSVVWAEARQLGEAEPLVVCVPQAINMAL